MLRAKVAGENAIGHGSFQEEVAVPTIEYQAVIYPTESPRFPGLVVYVRLKDWIIFTGLTKTGPTSHFVAAVIEAIAQREAFDYLFYDLQTHRGYAEIGRGEFMYQDISFATRNNRVVSPQLRSEPCPESVVDIFRQHIGGHETPYQMKSPQDHRRYVGASDI